MSAPFLPVCRRLFALNGVRKQAEVLYMCHRNVSVGDIMTTERTLQLEEVKNFADLTGDHNPIHIDPEMAKTTRFGRCIVHGLLTNGLISGALVKVCGPGAVLLSQEITFTAPLYVGETCKASAEIVDLRKRLVSLELTCTSLDRNEDVIKGSAKVLLPKPEKAAAS